MKENLFENLLPIAMKINAKTIAQDLITINPLSYSFYEKRKLEKEIKTINRDRKIDSILENSTFEEMKIEEHEDYQKLPGKLFYMDIIYK